jgi:hypothetical protein
VHCDSYQNEREPKSMYQKLPMKIAPNHPEKNTIKVDSTIET